jgi:hypothetical protein
MITKHIIMKFNQSLAVLLLLVLLAACSTPKYTTTVRDRAITPEQLHFIDSILQKGLDNEALYTLLTDLKPMSSLVTFSFPIASDDSIKKSRADILDRATHGKYLDRLASIQQAFNLIDIPGLQFILVPYRSADKNRRIIQLSVVRIRELDNLLREKECFFGQFGLVPGTDPNVVATVIESCDPYERWRGYGYLFGYPDYAVDFFVNAAKQKEQTGKFVKRNFFRIPTYAMPDEGNFVYAYPADHAPTAEVDSVIYYRAMEVLDDYREIRNSYLNADSALQSYKLIRDINKQRPSQKSRIHPGN